MASSVAWATARPPSRRSTWPSCQSTFWAGSWSRLGTSNGRTPASRASSATRAARLAERTDAKVAAASTSVPAAVASEATVGQSAIPAGYGLRAAVSRRRPRLALGAGEDAGAEGRGPVRAVAGPEVGAAPVVAGDLVAAGRRAAGARHPHGSVAR